MKDAVLLLMENRSPPVAFLSPFTRLTQLRPAHPILFLAKYFELLEAEQTAMQVRALTIAAAASSLLALARAAAGADASSAAHSALHQPRPAATTMLHVRQPLRSQLSLNPNPLPSPP